MLGRLTINMLHLTCRCQMLISGDPASCTALKGTFVHLTQKTLSVLLQYYSIMYAKVAKLIKKETMFTFQTAIHSRKLGA